MTSIHDEWLRPRRPREQFPPYALAEPAIVAQAEKRTASLGRIYHKAHKHAWDGPAVLVSLIDKHGGIHVPADKRAPLGRVASVLLWGELAAWSISADLALRLEDPAAKMAASSQVFDEARHFTVLREYLWRADVPIARLGGFSRALLVDLLETDNLVYKLVGMQLLVENAAVNLFKMIAAADIEPVLTDLLYYFERDEARHVGLGVLTLPGILPELSSWEAARLWAYQLRLELLMLAGGLAMREAFAALGVDQAALQRQTFQLHAEVHRRMRDADDGRGARATRGLLRVSRAGQRRLQAFLFPDAVPPGDGAADRGPSPLHRLALTGLIRAADRGDRWLSARAPAS